MAARPRKNNVKIPNLYPLYSRKVNKIYWRYKHPITGKFHSLGTNEAEATAIAIEANERLAEQRARQVLAISDKIATSKGKAITTNTWLIDIGKFRMKDLRMVISSRTLISKRLNQ